MLHKWGITVPSLCECGKTSNSKIHRRIMLTEEILFMVLGIHKGGITKTELLPTRMFDYNLLFLVTKDKDSCTKFYLDYLENKFIFI